VRKRAFTTDSIGGLDQLRRVQLDADAAALLAGAARRLRGGQRLGQRRTAFAGGAQ
jgi:hypothetical protein